MIKKLEVGKEILAEQDELDRITVSTKQSIRRTVAFVGSFNKTRPMEIRWSIGGAIVCAIGGALIGIGGVGIAAGGGAIGVSVLGVLAILALLGAIIGSRIGVEIDKRDIQ